VSIEVLVWFKHCETFVRKVDSGRGQYLRDLIRTRGTCHGRGDAGPLPKPCQGHLCRFHADFLRDAPNAFQNAPAPTCRRLFEAVRPDTAFPIGGRSILARQEAAGQAIERQYGDASAYAYRLQCAFIDLAFHQVVQGLENGETYGSGAFCGRDDLFQAVGGLVRCSDLACLA
jgi:hypothetical protein